MENRADFLHRRAVEEDAAANRAASDKARALHRELATRYREAVDDEGFPPEAETVSSTLPKEFRIIG
jgi:hypothetical protein